MKTGKCEYDVEKGTDDFKHPEVSNKESSREPCHSTSLAWMAFLNDDCPLSSLTIPGTHDSAAYTSSLPFVATQGMDILDQLKAGIRFFDLRCAIRDDVVEMVHGPKYLGLTLEWVFESMYMWLAMHPSEALVVQIKRDRAGQRSSRHMSEGVFALVAKTASRWRTENTTPSLGELRGRIQLFRRFANDKLGSFGIDVTEWQDNPSTPFTIVTDGVKVTIQDHYNFSDPQPLPSLLANKGGNVSGLMRRASSDRDPHHWYVNFTSAVEFNFWHQIAPRQIAVGGWHRFRWEEGMNVRLRSSLDQLNGRRRRFGIVVMDFPELGVEDLIPALIQTNFDTSGQRMRTASIIGAVLLMALLLLYVDIWTAGVVCSARGSHSRCAWLRNTWSDMYSTLVQQIG